MPARSFPGLGIKGGYADAESGWGSDMNSNLLKLSVLVQAGANGFVDALPGAPAQGDVYVLTTDQSINAYDNAAWVAFVPMEGWEIYDRDQNKAMRFDGAAWSEVTSGGGGDASFPPFAGNSGKVLTVNATEDGVEWDDASGGGGGGGGSGKIAASINSSDHSTTRFTDTISSYSTTLDEPIPVVNGTAVKVTLRMNKVAAGDVGLILSPDGIRGYGCKFQSDGNKVSYFYDGSRVERVAGYLIGNTSDTTLGPCIIEFWLKIADTTKGWCSWDFAVNFQHNQAFNSSGSANGNNYVNMLAAANLRLYIIADDPTYFQGCTVEIL